MAKNSNDPQPQGIGESLKIDDQLAAHCEVMQQKSIPNYTPLISMLKVMAERCVTPGSNVYDLGCAVGAAAISMATGIKKPGCRVFAIDNAEAMIKQCQKTIAAADVNTPILTMLDDIRHTEITDASMVVLNFTLQFIPLADRDALLKKIYAGMRHGGLLVLSEKIAIDDVAANALITDLHEIWKVDNGCNEMEMETQRAAIEKFMVAETALAHHERILRCGFRHCAQWFQSFNFISMLAFK